MTLNLKEAVCKVLGCGTRTYFEAYCRTELASDSKGQITKNYIAYIRRLYETKGSVLTRGDLQDTLTLEQAVSQVHKTRI